MVLNPHVVYRNLITIIFFLSSFLSFAQNEDISIIESNKNSINLKFGYGYYGPDFSYGLGLTYERQIFQFDKSFLLARAGWSYWALWGASANTYKLDLAYVIGKKSSHLELDLGMIITTECDDSYKIICTSYDKLRLSANIAYRYQKPGGRSIFRIGIGREALAFVSYGFAF